jgi:hypothetical protein
MDQPNPPSKVTRIQQSSDPSGQIGAVRGHQLEAGRAVTSLRGMTKRIPFCYFKTRPEIIHRAAMH